MAKQVINKPARVLMILYWERVCVVSIICIGSAFSLDDLSQSVRRNSDEWMSTSRTDRRLVALPAKKKWGFNLQTAFLCWRAVIFSQRYSGHNRHTNGAKFTFKCHIANENRWAVKNHNIHTIVFHPPLYKKLFNDFTLISRGHWGV